MIDIKRILLPTDFSESSLVAIEYGRELAKAFESELHLMHVMQDPDYLARSAESYAVLPDVRLEMEQFSAQQFKDVIDKQGLGDFELKQIAHWGEPFVEIVKYSKDNEMDLIVMGTHGRGAITHMLLGSVAEKVVRKAPCPVLTVRHPKHEFIHP